MSDEQLIKVEGGAFKKWINATFLNSVTKAVETIFKIGESFGKSVSIIIFGRKC